MEKIEVQSDVRYVIGTMIDGRPKFQVRDFVNKTYSFTDNIALATKAVSRKLADIVLNGFGADGGLAKSLECSILPIEVTYRILDNDGVVIDAEVTDE